MFRKQLDEGLAGDNVGVLLRGIQRDEIERGQAVSYTHLQRAVNLSVEILCSSMK